MKDFKQMQVDHIEKHYNEHRGLLVKKYCSIFGEYNITFANGRNANKSGWYLQKSKPKRLAFFTFLRYYNKKYYKKVNRCNMDLEKIDRGLFRLKIPFMSVTTTVYIYTCRQGTAIIDSATYPTDVDGYILPALDAMGVRREDVKAILLTHGHGDHAGGLQRLCEALPHAAVRTSFETDLPNAAPLADGEMVLGNLQAVFLPGHTYDSYGFFDTATKTLLSGDCLQLAGIGCYRNNISNVELYALSVCKLQQMDIRRIVAAHEFDPLGSIAEGAAAVENYLNQCIQIVQRS